MFNTFEAFKRQFTPVEGGYLVYPSRKVGGKLVTEAEYEQLVADWGRIAGRAGRWKTAGAVVALILLVDSLSPPDWADTLLIGLVLMAVFAWLLWASTAPSRLVKDRPPVSSPRPSAEAKREGRAALNWPLVISALVGSGSVFFGSVAATDRTASTWAWLLGSGAMLSLYLWIGFKKLLDGRS